MHGGGAAGHPDFRLERTAVKFAIAYLIRGYALLLLEIAERISPELEELEQFDLRAAIPAQREPAVGYWRFRAPTTD